MKPVPELNSSDGDKLLNAVLADEEWQAFHSRLRDEGLATLELGRRRRRWRVHMAQACAMAVFVLAATVLNRHWQTTPPLAPAPSSSNRSVAASAAPFISEEEMLAMFPAGSCVVAEVDGQKRLVFFEPIQAEAGFALDRSAVRSTHQQGFR